MAEQSQVERLQALANEPAYRARTDDFRRRLNEAPDDTLPDITAPSAGAFGASPELTAAWLAVMEAGIKSGEMPGNDTADGLVAKLRRYLEISRREAADALAERDVAYERAAAFCQRHIVVRQGTALTGHADDYGVEHFGTFYARSIRSWIGQPPVPKQDRSRADRTGGEDAA